MLKWLITGKIVQKTLVAVSKVSAGDLVSGDARVLPDKFIIKIRLCHDDAIKWKHMPRYWPFVRGIHRSPMNSPHKGQCHGALMFYLIYAWTNDWVNNREPGDLRHHRAHYDVIIMAWDDHHDGQYIRSYLLRYTIYHGENIWCSEWIYWTDEYHVHHNWRMMITWFTLSLFVLKLFIIYYCDFTLSVIYEIVTKSIKYIVSYIEKHWWKRGNLCHFCDVFFVFTILFWEHKMCLVVRYA